MATSWRVGRANWAQASLGSLRVHWGPRRCFAYVLATESSYCALVFPATLDVEMSFVVPGNDSKVSSAASHSARVGSAWGTSP